MTHVKFLDDGECMRDETFIFTKPWNDWMIERPLVVDKLLIFSSFLMDFIQMVGLVMYAMKSNTIRGPIAFGLFFPMRQYI